MSGNAVLGAWSSVDHMNSRSSGGSEIKFKNILNKDSNLSGVGGTFPFSRGPIGTSSKR